MADTREILLKLIGRETVSDAAKKAARGLDDMGDAADDSARDVKKLDRAIADTEKTIARLKAQARDSDDPLSFMRDIGKAERNLKNLNKLADDGAAGFSARFAARLGPVMAKAPLGPAFAIPLAAAAAGAAPVIAGVLSAGIVGGIAAAGVGAGVALAIADDPRVAAAGKRLALTVRTSLTDAAAPFRKETLAAIGDVQDAFVELRPLLQDIFGDASKFLRPLVAGVTGAIAELGPGIAAAVDKAGPVIDVISRKLPELGRTIGNQIEMIAGGSDDAAKALSSLFTVLQVGISTVGPSLRALTETFGLLDKAGLLTGFIGIADKMGLFNTNAKEMHRRGEDVVGALDGINSSASGAATEVKTLAEQIRDFSAAQVAAVNSEIAFEEAIDNAAAAAKENGKTLDTNTAKGRANMEALAGLVTQTQAHAEETRNATHSQERVNEVMQRGYNKFIAAAIAMGKTEAEARQLAGSMGLIPTQKTITIKYPTMTAAEIKARALAAGINSIDTYKEILIVQRLQTKGVRISGVTGAGGFTERAAGGSMLPGKRYLVGERGPELLQMGNAAGTVTPNHRLPASGDSGQVAAAVVSALAKSGLQVVMDGSVVGRLQANRADLLQRGG